MSKAILVLLYILASVSATLAASWPTAHGSPTNTGFARVDTRPATFPTGFADVGRVAPGVNPVTGPDGTVYIGNLAGEVIALFPDGRLFWKRMINPEHGAIFASPAVGADGSIYVVMGSVARLCTRLTRPRVSQKSIGSATDSIVLVRRRSRSIVLTQWSAPSTVI